MNMLLIAVVAMVIALIIHVAVNIAILAHESLDVLDHGRDCGEDGHDWSWLVILLFGWVIILWSRKGAGKDEEIRL